MRKAIFFLFAISTCVATMGSALFANNADYLRTTSTPAYVGDFTVSLWFKVANTTDRHTLLLMQHNTWANQRFVLYADGPDTNSQTDRVWYIMLRSGGGVDSTGYTANSFSANTWHHVLFSVEDYDSEAADYNISLDGGNAGSAPSASQNRPGWSDYYVQIGGDGRTIAAITGAYDVLPSPTGSVAEVAIWSGSFDKTYKDGIMLRNWISPVLLRRNSLVFYAPLIRDTQELISGCTLTATNSPGVGDHGPIRR